MKNIGMHMTSATARSLLKIILWAYIILCLLVAGMNFGIAPNSSAATAAVIKKIFEFYENEFKTFVIILCIPLSLISVEKEKRSRNLKTSLAGFGLTALIFHIALPLMLRNKDIYFMMMPPPWSTVALQLMEATSSFYAHYEPLWGLAGIGAAIAVFYCMTAVVFIGTLLFGRRLQCSALCLLNGFIAEIWAPVLPLIGKEKKTGGKSALALSVLRWVIFVVSMFFTAWWVMKAAGSTPAGKADLIAGAETVMYLTLGVFLSMIFWIVWTGRGYCYYCPLGTFLALAGKIAGQKIRTDRTKCIGCGKCVKACPMSIDVASAAKLKKNVTNLACVGCGHCVDACPVGTLAYETRFLRLLRTKRG